MLGMFTPRKADEALQAPDLSTCSTNDDALRCWYQQYFTPATGKFVTRVMISCLSVSSLNQNKWGHEL
ncbi:hypothetical protein E2C01_027064 [Portunus trituberculatus]|uniref:Uncharacterized protein n=1 Tax=Portunus trituberculatus TaxID=210409 RepID=A0A5B7EJW6_PORTR|nr:hypothetical protein [Portunus trituberculatus]